MATTPINLPDLDTSCLTIADLQNQFVRIEQYVNSLCARLDALGGPGANLSNLVDQATLDAHKNAACPHPGMVKIAGIAGCPTMQYFNHTQVAATDTVAYPTAMTSVMSVQATPLQATPASVAVSAITPTNVKVSAPIGTVTQILVLGLP